MVICCSGLTLCFGTRNCFFHSFVLLVNFMPEISFKSFFVNIIGDVLLDIVFSLRFFFCVLLFSPTLIVFIRWKVRVRKFLFNSFCTYSSIYFSRVHRAFNLLENLSTTSQFSNSAFFKIQALKLQENA